ncbi:MAG: hypothetical protein MZV70_18275 [Desulfobacterales bacterium]|nr:hypothetical protein [Desulfobacterales bacterium]
MKQTQYKDAAEALGEGGRAGLRRQGGPVRPRRRLRGPARISPRPRRPTRSTSPPGPAEAWTAYLTGWASAGRSSASTTRPSPPCSRPRRPSPRTSRSARPWPRPTPRPASLENAEAVYMAHGRVQSRPRPRATIPSPTRCTMRRESTTRPSSRSRRSSSSIPRTRRITTISGMAYFKAPAIRRRPSPPSSRAVAIKPDFEHAWYQIGSSNFQRQEVQGGGRGLQEIRRDQARRPVGLAEHRGVLHPGQGLRGRPRAAEEVRRDEARRLGGPGQPGHRLHQPQGQLQRQGDLQQAR